ncbi:unnamed protein product [Laminaria digitata]
MDPGAGHHPYGDYYGGGYGHPPPVFNAYGQPMGAYGPPPHMGMGHPGSAEILPPSVQMRLDHLVATGFCYPGDIDDRCRKFLREVPEHVALQAIDEFMAADRHNIRKVSAYFMGVIRKHAENYRSGAPSGAGGSYPPGGPAGAYDVGSKRMRDYNHESQWANKLSKPEGGGLMERLADAPQLVQAGVQGLLTKGIASEWDFDTRVSNTLLQLTEQQATEAIEEFASCDMSRIRNKSAYLMGLLKRYKSGGPPPPGLAR